MAFRQKSAARIALGVSLVLILLTGLLVFGGPTLERFHLRGAGGEGISSDFRWLIFRDTWQLIRTSPWCGIGLGNFEPIFAISRMSGWTAPVLEQYADNKLIRPRAEYVGHVMCRMCRLMSGDH